jgi:site-specific recombinase XerD
LARLGFRAGEIVALALDDIDWENGDILVRGKGQRLVRLPLPSDVGEALVEYLRDVRPTGRTRRLFLRIRAPLRGLAGSVSVDCIVARALKRAGLAPPLKGAHLLRHSLATNLLRQGASLAEIGQLLRHSQPNTTQIYAKVDIEALRGIAVAWPAGAP